jgi:Tat protein secretion system quality control protein TatD with DNase activity
MSRVVDGTGHIGKMRRVRLHEEPVPWYGFEPPPLSVDRLSKLLDSPAVTALGEVGIDCSEGAKPFGIQSSTLKWVLALARRFSLSGSSGHVLGSQ